MAEEINAKFTVDLSELQTRLQGITSQQRAADAALTRTDARARESEGRVRNLERLESRISTKLRGLSRQLFRAGAVTVAGAVFDDLGIESSFLGRLAGGGLTGAAFGGVPGAGIGLVIVALNELTTQVKDTIKRMGTLERRIIEDNKRLDKMVKDREEDRRKAEEREKKARAELFERMQEEAGELNYQTLRFMAMQDRE